MKIMRFITLIFLFLLVGFYINAIQPKATKNVLASDVTGIPTNTPQATNTQTPVSTATVTINPPITIVVTGITANPTCTPLPLCFYDHPSCALALPIGNYCPGITVTVTPTSTPTVTATATPTDAPTQTPSPTLPPNCTPITVYLNGVAVIVCQEQLQSQNQSINFNPVINNNPTNNNNNTNTNNNNLTIANNGHTLGAVYSPSSASSLPGTGVPNIIWEVLGGITPLGFVLRRIAHK